MHGAVKELVERRATRVRALIRHIRGEMDWIIAKLDDADGEIDRIYNLIDEAKPKENFAPDPELDDWRIQQRLRESKESQECPNCGGAYGAATLGCRCKPEAGND